MPVTAAQMEQMFPGSGRFADPINQTVSNYEINNVPMFIAQIGHESGGLTVFIENLHYSADRLLQVFPRYFNDDNVDNYDNQPEKIANRIYANRMGNGDEASGDGWKYRGRGAIQLTGKNNYLKLVRKLVTHLIKLLHIWKQMRAQLCLPDSIGMIII